MAIFDKEASAYDGWYESKMGAFVDQVETDLALKMFDIQPGMKILDVGCGTGNFSIKLAEMGCRVTGVDISQEMLKEARKKAQDKNLDIDFIYMDMYDLDLPDQEFDGVFSMAAFEFIKEGERAYRELYRVLKPKGELLIGTINKDSSWGELYLSQEFQENSVFKHADFKTMEDLIRLNPEAVKDQGECLFIPPMAAEEEISLEKEEELSKRERGGYICVLWKKE